jgi:hypothetical protein
MALAHQRPLGLLFALLLVSGLGACSNGTTYTPPAVLETLPPSPSPSPIPFQDLGPAATTYQAASDRLAKRRLDILAEFYEVPEADPKHLSLVWSQLRSAYQEWVDVLASLTFIDPKVTEAQIKSVTRYQQIVKDLQGMVDDPFDSPNEIELRNLYATPTDDSDDLVRAALKLAPEVPLASTHYDRSPDLSVGTVATIYDEGQDGTISFVPIGTIGVRYVQWSHWVAPKVAAGATPAPPTPDYLAVLVEYHALGNATLSYCYDNQWIMTSGSTPVPLASAIANHKFGLATSQLGCGVVGKNAYTRAWLIYQPKKGASLVLSYYRDFVKKPYFTYSFQEP